MSGEVESFGPEREEREKVGDGAVAPTDSLEMNVGVDNTAEVKEVWRETTEENGLEVDRLGNSAPGETSYVEQLRQMVNEGDVQQVRGGHSGDAPDMVAQLVGALVKQIEDVKKGQDVVKGNLAVLRERMTTEDLPDGFDSDSFRKRRDI